jgi:hypothetical protein
VPSTRTDRAFGRGVRIAAGIAAVLVMIFMVVIVERDHPLKWDTHHNTPAVDRAAVQAGDAGPLPSTGIAPANTSGVVVHPGKTQSDLKP